MTNLPNQWSYAGKRHTLFIAKIRVTLKPTINDPQGKTIAQGLGRLGFDTIESLRAGKYFEVRLNEDDRQIAERKAKEMCEKLLANPVIELFDFEVEPVAEPAAAS